MNVRRTLTAFAGLVLAAAVARADTLKTEAELKPETQLDSFLWNDQASQLFNLPN